MDRRKFMFGSLAFPLLGRAAGRGVNTKGRLAIATPEAVGFSSDRLQRLDAAMERSVAEGEYAGVVTLLARHGKVVHRTSHGKRDLASGASLQTDAIFRIFSMSKPITAAAMMILYEEGKWNPQDPIYELIPEFAHLKVYKELDGYGALVLEDPVHPPTMRELMTHTAGFAYGQGQGPVDRRYRDEHEGSIFSTGSLQAMIDRLSKAPLLYQPSARWVYSLSVDIQGYIIEKLSGMSLPEFLRKRLFTPLNMPDTDFYVPAEKRDRFSTLYKMNDKGELVPSEAILGIRYEEKPALPQGGAGLVSTAQDYYRFAQMLLNGGELDGTRILGPQTVKLMISNHLPDRLATQFNGGEYLFIQPRPGFGYGFGGAVVTDPGQADLPIGKGSYLWDGAAGTWFWVDPTYDIVFVGMVQRLAWGSPTSNFHVPPNLEELSRAEAYQALLRPDL